MSLKNWKSLKTLIELAYDIFLLLFLGGVIFPLLVKMGQGHYPIDASDIVVLRRSIIGQESAGNYRAVNPDSGALGYGQVMPENVPSWSYQALGYSLTAEEFLANPDLQVQIIDHKLAEYWQDALSASNGDETIAVRMVASRWYSGSPHLYDSTNPQFYNGTQYPSIADYTLSVLSKFQQGGG